MITYTVSCYDMTWGNADSAGDFATEEEARSHCAGEKADFCGFEAFVETDEESQDSTLQIILPHEGDAVYCLEMPDWGDYRLHGPYQGIDEMNGKLFGENARKKFKMVAGTFGPGCYAIHRGGSEWIPLFAYREGE